MNAERDKVTVYQDDADEWRWRRTAGNGEIIADSGEGYVDKARALEMARRVNPLVDELVVEGDDE